MTKKTVYLTKEGLDELKQELHFLRTKERPRIADAIAEARSKGDLSENAEYDAAKEEQEMLELKISEVEALLGQARIVDEKTVDTSAAYILSTVTVKNHKTGSNHDYTLVSAREADLANGKISIDSPIGKGLLGKTVGEIVTIEIPAGKIKLEVLEIARRI